MYTMLIFLLVLLVPTISIARDVRGNKVSPYSAVLMSIISTMTAVLVVVAVARFMGHPLFQSYHEYAVQVTQVIVRDSSLLNMTGMTGLSEADATKTLIALYDRMFGMMPGYVLLASTIMSYFGYIFISKAQSRKHQVQLMPKFKEFRFPNGIVMAMVAMYVIAFLISKSGMNGADLIYQNVNYLFDLVFVIEGAAVTFMVCDLKKWPKVIAIIIVIIFWNVYILRQALILVGIFDLIFNLRGFIVFKQQLREQRKQERKNRRR